MVYLAAFVFTHLQYKDRKDRHTQKQVERVCLEEANVTHLPRSEVKLRHEKQ